VSVGGVQGVSCGGAGCRAVGDGSGGVREFRGGKIQDASRAAFTAVPVGAEDHRAADARREGGSGKGSGKGFDRSGNVCELSALTKSAR
jgi:hypothetical protein